MEPCAECVVPLTGHPDGHSQHEAHDQRLLSNAQSGGAEQFASVEPEDPSGPSRGLGRGSQEFCGLVEVGERSGVALG